MEIQLILDYSMEEKKLKYNNALDESVSKFEEGIKLSKDCSKILEEAEKKITILVNKDGETKEENFETE